MLLEFKFMDGKPIMINSQSIHAVEDSWDMPGVPCRRITYSSGSSCFNVDTEEPMTSIVDRVNLANKSENRF